MKLNPYSYIISECLQTKYYVVGIDDIKYQVR